MELSNQIPAKLKSQKQAFWSWFSVENVNHFSSSDLHQIAANRFSSFAFYLERLRLSAR